MKNIQTVFLAALKGEKIIKKFEAICPLSFSSYTTKGQLIIRTEPYHFTWSELRKVERAIPEATVEYISGRLYVAVKL